MFKLTRFSLAFFFSELLLRPGYRHLLFALKVFRLRQVCACIQIGFLSPGQEEENESTLRYKESQRKKEIQDNF